MIETRKVLIIGRFMLTCSTATLGPTDADEAFTLIPSLRTKFTNLEMEDITKRIAELKTFE